MVSGLSEYFLDVGHMILEAGQIFTYAWPISIGVFALAVCGYFLRRAEPISTHGKLMAPLMAIYIFPFALLALAVLLQYDGPPHPDWREPPAWRNLTISAALIIDILVVVAAVAYVKGQRLRTIALMFPALWMALCAYVPSQFLVYGVWP